MNLVTKVGAYAVPVRRASHPTLWYFTAGARGRHEAGVYAFWTAVLARKAKNRIWGRALVVLPPGDRFDRMKREKPTLRHWRELLQRGAAIRYIRPSTEREVRHWMRTHQSDAKYALLPIADKHVYNWRLVTA